MEVLSLESAKREEFINITSAVRRLIAEHGWRSGLLCLFCPHTTAALTVNEAADPAVKSDMTVFLRELVPQKHEFEHAEGNSDAHVKTSLLGPSLTLLVEDGLPLLGTWQGIYFYEGDGPRSRQIWLKFLAG